AEDGIRDRNVTGVQTRALPIYGIAPMYADATCSQALTRHVPSIQLECFRPACRRLRLQSRSRAGPRPGPPRSRRARARADTGHRSEEHTSELQSRFALVCRLLL